MISVCMCTYNGERYVEEQLDSIRMQTCVPDEVVICDDCSTDNTVFIVRSYIEKYGLQDSWKLICNNVNKGYPTNFYYCMSKSKGDLVFLADQDDLWKLDKIEKMLQVMKKYPSIEVLSCCLRAIDENGLEIRGILAPKGMDSDEVHSVSISEVLYKDCWAGMTLVYRNEFYKQIQERVENSRLPHDRAIWTIAADRGSFYQLDSTLAFHRRHGSNACEEEHRVSKLMRYERKLQEIQVYMEYMQGLLDTDVQLSAETRNAVREKLERLRIRYQNLKERKLFSIVYDYIVNHHQVRVVTMLCDVGIVLFRR